MGLSFRRGDIVVVSATGDYGKPRPGIVVQSNAFSKTASVTYCPITSLLNDNYLLRITVEPDSSNGLKQTSQIMIDKIITAPRSKIGKIIGHANDELMLNVTRALAIFLVIG
jgi:mRNA interferase MazF